MTRPLSSHDYEALSAYLDGELSSKEQARVEARIHASPEWKAGLEELRYTHTILRRTPMRRAPRNFTLKPSMVSRRVISPAFPMFRLASALASILLIVAFASDYFLSYGFGMSTSRSAIPAAQSSEIAPQVKNNTGLAPAAGAQLYTESTQTANLEQTLLPASSGLSATSAAPLSALAATETTPVPAYGLGGGGCDVNCPTATEQPLTIASGPTNPEGTPIGLGGGEPPTDETQQASIAMTNAPQGMGGGEPLPTATELAPGFSYYAKAETETPTPQTESTLRQSPPLAAAPAQDQAATATNAPNALQSTPFGEHTALRIIEIVLAVTALGTGAIALFLRLHANP